MSEIEKLRATIEADGIIGGHVSWGPSAAELSPEDRAKVINEVFARSKMELGITVAVPVSQLIAIADALHGVSGFCQRHVNDWLKMDSAVVTVLHEVRDIIGMAPALAEQCLPKEVQAERREKHLREMRERNNAP